MIDISTHYKSSCYTANKTAAKQEPRAASSSFSATEGDPLAKAMELYENKLFLGSTRRTKLSDTEITALANKYNPYDMSTDEYESFLDDLMDMGAISPFERQEMRADGLKVEKLGGGWASSAQGVYGGSPCFHWFEAEGDVYRWSTDRATYTKCGPLTPEEEREASRVEDGYKARSGIVSRMATARPEGKKASGGDGQGIVSQFADPTSQLYQGLIGKMKDRMKDAAVDEQEQDVVDALDDVLEAMNERKANGRKSNLTQATAKISTVAQTYKPGDPRRVQLEQAANQMERLGIQLQTSGKTSESGGQESETLTQRLIREEQENASPGIPDLFGNEV